MNEDEYATEARDAAIDVAYEASVTAYAAARAARNAVTAPNAIASAAARASCDTIVEALFKADERARRTYAAAILDADRARLAAYAAADELVKRSP